MIEQFTVENLKAIEKVSLSLEGNLLLLHGPCAVGKSSLADAAVFVLNNGDPPPVRTGCDEGKVVARLRGGYIVERRVTAEGKKTLVVKQDGPLGPSQLAKPASVLDALLKGVPVDVDECLQMDHAKELVPLLLRLQGADKAEQLADLRAKEKRYFDARKEAKAEAKSLKGRADGINIPDHIPSKDEIAAASAAIDAARAQIDAHEDEVSAYLDMLEAAEIAQGDVETATDAVAAAQEALRKAEATLAATISNRDSLKKRVDEAADPRVSGWVAPDIGELADQRDDLVRKSGMADMAAQKQRLLAQAEAKEQEAAQWDENLSAARGDIQHLFDGLECVRMTEDGVLEGLNLRGVWEPLQDLSDSERIVAMAHVLAAGGAPFVRIRHGAELDQTQMANLAAVAQKYPKTDFWVEVVRFSGGELVLTGADVSEMVTGPVVSPLASAGVVAAVIDGLADLQRDVQDGTPDAAGVQDHITEAPAAEFVPEWARPGAAPIDGIPEDEAPPVRDPNQKGLFE